MAFLYHVQTTLLSTTVYILQSCMEIELYQVTFFLSHHCLQGAASINEVLLKMLLICRYYIDKMSTTLNRLKLNNTVF